MEGFWSSVAEQVNSEVSVFYTLDSYPNSEPTLANQVVKLRSRFRARRSTSLVGRVRAAGTRGAGRVRGSAAYRWLMSYAGLARISAELGKIREAGVQQLS